MIPIEFEGVPQGKLTRDDVEDSFAKLYSGKHRSKLAWADALRNTAVFEAIVRAEPCSVLDIGCGNNATIGRFIACEKLDTQYTGIDVTDERAKVAESINLLKPRRDARGLKCDASQKLPFDDGSFAFVTCLEVAEAFFHGWADVARFLDDVKRVLMPFGQFVFATSDTPPGTPLSHPTCHDWECSHQQLLAYLKERFDVPTWYTYRARPRVGQPLPIFPESWPFELRWSLSLPALTQNKDGFPGSKLYFCKRA